ncbi:MAG: GatB/YqeY domain-containing protein [Xanthomonadales bacterium]|nr:GatB/YqeY domain-containing protein [Xanthomonadales bacterium]
MRDMGKVMGLLRPRVQGRVDMQEVSTLVRSKLSA